MRARWNATSLFWRVFGLNGAVLVAAGLALVVTPATVSSPVQAKQVVVLAAGVAVLLVVDLVLLRRALAPLDELIAGTRRVDLLQPGRRIHADGPSRELIDLATAFNEMLGRLEAERRAAARQTFEAIEQERTRIARDLHDQVGQDLTALMLQLDGPSRELTRDTLNAVRGIVYELRPDPIEELGLAAALESMAARMRAATPVDVRADVQELQPRLDRVTELAAYRIAQEAVTNALRHAEATAITIVLRGGTAGEVSLVVHDDGRPGARSEPGAGLRGVRERAITIAAGVAIEHGPQGTRVALEIPA